MAGIYIHIPYCKQKCNYCNFHFSTSLNTKNDMILCINKELELRSNFFNETIETIYLGGGTPSVLTGNEIESIFRSIYTHYKVSDEVEVTLEANPDDLTIDKICFIKSTPINRFSIGIQSFYDKDLRFMNRAHNAKEAFKSIEEVKKAGFENITIDLIYGVPNSNNWKDNLKYFFDLEIPHLSSYALTVEDKTVLKTLIDTKKVSPVNDLQQEKEYLYLVESLRENNFDHYEVSNFAKKGWQSKHNSNYWKSKSYIGIGPSAHSFDGVSRQWNISNNMLYIKSLKKEVIPFEVEKLNLKDLYNEKVMIGLRTEWGVDLEAIKLIGADFENYLIKTSEKYRVEDKIRIERGRLKLNPEYRFFADGIAADLFMIE